MKIWDFSHRSVTRHGVINWEEFGEKFWWVVLHSEWRTKMQFFAQLFAQDFARSKTLVAAISLWGMSSVMIPSESVHCLFRKCCFSGELKTLYIHIWYVQLWSYYLGQGGPLQGLLSGPSLFSFWKHGLSKSAIRGVSEQFFENQNSCAQKSQGLLSGPSWPCLCCNKLGPDNNPYLAQIITPHHGIFVFCF